jgi:hypothetical protein
MEFMRVWIPEKLIVMSNETNSVYLPASTIEATMSPPSRQINLVGLNCPPGGPWAG